jgi:hypothetical protein
MLVLPFSFYIDNGQERCHFSWPTEQQSIDVGAGGADCQRISDVAALRFDDGNSCAQRSGRSPHSEPTLATLKIVDRGLRYRSKTISYTYRKVQEPFRSRESVWALDLGVKEEDLVEQAWTKRLVKPGCDGAFAKEPPRRKPVLAGHWISLAVFVLCKVPLQPEGCPFAFFIGGGRRIGGMEREGFVNRCGRDI